MRPLKIFLNYRHDDTQGTAWAVYIKLVERFGAESVFFDNGTLKPGMPWFDEIKEHVAAGGVFIALLGPRWLSILKSRMQRGEDDYVAKEIDLAFQTGPRVNVIPVLVEDAELPIPSQLPPSVGAGALGLPLRAPDLDALSGRHGAADSAARGPSTCRNKEPSWRPAFRDRSAGSECCCGRSGARARSSAASRSIERG
jgi:hypothetical protein